MGSQRQPARAMVALATALSNPIHVDARKRTKVERPDAAEDDVRLAQRSRNAPARAPAPARALQPAAAAAANTAGGGLGRWAVLFDATGDALLELLPDLTVCRSFTTTSYGYPASALSGESILRLIHPEERPALQQTAQALLAMALGGGGSAGPAAGAPGRFAVRVQHRVLFCAAVPGGAHQAISVDSLVLCSRLRRRHPTSASSSRRDARSAGGRRRRVVRGRLLRAAALPSDARKAADALTPRARAVAAHPGRRDAILDYP